MVAGPIAIAYNVDGVKDLTLNAEVAAKIFSGQISSWDDAAIKALNPSATLPSTKISVVLPHRHLRHHGELHKYLNAAAPTPGPPPARRSGRQGEGREGSAGVAQAVAGASGGITYVEWSYAQDNKLSVAKIDNGSGAVELTGESAGKTVATRDPGRPGQRPRAEDRLRDEGVGRVPDRLVTYEIVCSKGLDSEKTALLKSFLNTSRGRDPGRPAGHRLRSAAQRGLREGAHGHRGHRLTRSPNGNAAAQDRNGGRAPELRCPPPRFTPSPHVPSRTVQEHDVLDHRPLGRRAGAGPSGDNARGRRSLGDTLSAAAPVSPASSSSRSSSSPASSWHQRRPVGPRRQGQLPALDRVAGLPGDLRFGILQILWTTVSISVIAMIIAVPLGVANALFLTQYAPKWLARPAASVIDLLAAIPSIVYGLLGHPDLRPAPDRLQTFLNDALGGSRCSPARSATARCSSPASCWP